MFPGVECRHNEDSPKTPILSRIHPISYIETHLFKMGRGEGSIVRNFIVCTVHLI
jgi:hypothetical protein